MISLVIAGDPNRASEGLRRALETERDFQVCDHVPDGGDLLERIEKHRPQVVIFDVGTQPRRGLEALERIRSTRPETKAIVLSTRGDARFFENASARGADGYLPENADADDIARAIRAVTQGGGGASAAPERVVGRSLRAAGAQPEIPAARLTAREREVLQLIAEGLSAKEIANDLHISTKTVETHRTSLMRKIGVRKATALVRYAFRHGLIEP